ncbi:hypothetical protein BDV11DRAFT_57933 [Aspergillus similis]
MTMTNIQTAPYSPRRPVTQNTRVISDLSIPCYPSSMQCSRRLLHAQPKLQSGIQYHSGSGCRSSVVTLALWASGSSGCELLRSKYDVGAVRQGVGDQDRARPLRQNAISVGDGVRRIELAIASLSLPLKYQRVERHGEADESSHWTVPPVSPVSFSSPEN